MYNNNDRGSRTNMGSIPILDNYYNNAPQPTNLSENAKEKCLFQGYDNKFNVTQDNSVNFDNFNNRGNYTLKQNFKVNDLIHNNLDENVTNEFIDERDIIIDTIDRNISVFPNIFSFTLKLGSTDTTPGPTIYRQINNVKYIKLVRIVLPDNYQISYYSFDSNSALLNLRTCIQNFVTNNFTLLNDGSTLFDQKYENSNEIIYIIHYYTNNDNFYIDYFREENGEVNYNIIYQAIVNDTILNANSVVNSNYIYKPYEDTQLEKGRYYQLHIDQLPQNNDLATNSSLSQSYSLLIPSREDGRGLNILNGLETDKIFKFSNLGNFSSFKIEIRDAVGEILTYDTTIWNSNLSTSEYNSSKKILNINNTTQDKYKFSFRSPDKYIRHPLCWRSQALFVFTIGEVSQEINKKTFS